MTHDFDGKHALVVGGAGGIGAETVRRLRAAGAQVLVIDRDEARLQDLARDTVDDGPDISVRVADTTDRVALEAIFEAWADRHTPLDIHIHIAGLSGRRWGDGPIDQCTDEGWETVLHNNLYGVYLSNQLAVRRMKDQGFGTIVNVSSVLGLVGVRDHFVTHAYAASRGGVISLSRSMATYYAQFGVRVNCVCPGLLDTPMSARAIGNETIRAALTDLQPLAPHVGAPDDVARAILYLAGDGARFVTGVTLPVDGGWSAQ